MKKLHKALLYIFLGMLPPLIAAAQANIIPAPPDKLRGSVLAEDATASELIHYIINLGLGIVGLIAVVFIIYGGFRYITSAGNDEAAESGKKILTNSIIGLIVVILSYVIITVILNAIVYNRT